MEGSKYQIGDVVTIKKLTEEDDLLGKYRFGLNLDMLAVSGKSFKIEDITTTCSSPGKIPDDGYRYKLEGIGWSWASSMFEDDDDADDLAPYVHVCKSSVDSNIGAFIQRKKCPELDFNLH